LQQVAQPGTIQKLGAADGVNLSNPEDVLVPSWYALQPAISDGSVLLPGATCANQPSVPGELAAAIQLNHRCVLDTAAGIVAGIVEGFGCPACQIRPRPSVTINLCGVAPGAQVTAARGGAS